MGLYFCLVIFFSIIQEICHGKKCADKTCIDAGDACRKLNNIVLFYVWHFDNKNANLG